ncbi:MAG: thiamine pyrophosphate-binding protein [Gammaproteobacteria bacterium]|nr:thiamine pyrophosphate-binding protein [Gammaproteobacteria bacterium]
MKTLVRQLLDEQISRRGFVKEMMLLGVSLSSARALLASISEAGAAELAAGDAIREVNGNGSDVLFDTLIEANVKYVFHGCGAGTNRFFDSIMKRPQITNFLATNEGQCVAAAEAYNIASGGELGVAIIPKAGLGNAQGNIYNALINRSPVLILTARTVPSFPNGAVISSSSTGTCRWTRSCAPVTGSTVSRGSPSLRVARSPWRICRRAGRRSCR